MSLNQYDALIGALIPLIVGFFTKYSWPGYVKSLAVLIFSLIAATIRLDLAGQLDWSNLANSFFVIVAAAGVTYKTVTESLARKLQTVGPVSDPTVPPASVVAVPEAN